MQFSIFMMRWLISILLASSSAAFAVDGPWQSALSRMPLVANVAELNRTNCVGMMLHAFQSNDVVKALVFMPGATDEFYMFRRAKAMLTNDAPTLLDAVTALTNQTRIRITFRPPLLLLHSDEDPLEPLFEITHEPTAEKVRDALFVPHAIYDDRDWDFLLPILKKNYRVIFLPQLHTVDSFHFYRHSFAAWNLTGWEGLEAVSLAGKTRFRIEKKRVVFEGDERVRKLPEL